MRVAASTTTRTSSASTVEYSATASSFPATNWCSRIRSTNFGRGLTSVTAARWTSRLAAITPA
jgi:hypothetical protein